MKKNAMMKIAAILMVAVLLTTCAISSTFAKYVSADSLADQARVAKWGVVLTVNGDPFADEYTMQGTSVVKNTTDDMDLVAPGTANDNALSFSISGKPEVATILTVKDSKGGKNFVTLSNWEQSLVAGGDQSTCPIKFTITVDGTPTEYFVGKTSGEDKIDNATELAAAVNAAISAIIDSTTFAPNAEIASSFTLGWEWAFGTNSDVDDATNKNDTLLGDIADKAATDSNLKKPTIGLDFVVSIEQNGASDAAVVNP